MSKSPKQREEWIPCPPGKLAKFAGQERVRQRRQFLVRAGSACGAVVAAVGIGWFAYRRFGMPMDPVYAGIACSRVRELGPKFMMGQLDEELTQQIKSHVEQCEACRTLFESMQPKMSSYTPQQDTQEQCQCSTCRRDGLNVNARPVGATGWSSCWRQAIPIARCQRLSLLIDRV